MEMTFRLGKNRGRVDATNTDGVDELLLNIQELVAHKAAEIANNRFDARILRNTLDSLISRDLNNAADFAVTQMIGIVPRQFNGPHVISFSAFQGGVYNPETKRTRDEFSGRIFTQGNGKSGERVLWDQLQRSTVEKKFRRTKNHMDANRFFKDRGVLAKNMVQNLGTIAGRTGTVSLRIQDHTVKAGSRNLRARAREVHPLKDINIRILPKLRQSMLQTLQSYWTTPDKDRGVQLAQFLGLSSEDALKLANPKGSHRPLLEPVLSYWLLNRIPFSIRSALNRSIRK